MRNDIIHFKKMADDPNDFLIVDFNKTVAKVNG